MSQRSTEEEIESQEETASEPEGVSPSAENESAETLEPEVVTEGGELLAALNEAEGRAQAAEQKLKEVEERVLRTLADMDNLRRRLQRDKEDAIKRTTSNLLEGFLPIWDNFSMGLQAVEKATDPAAFVQGFTMVGDQFKGFLEQNGLTLIDPSGEAFDPNLHECLSAVPHDSLPDQHVVNTIRVGFRIGQHLVRPASVIISSGPAAADPTPENTTEAGESDESPVT
jgi:molecular chaperone GrpE